jgi:hypothetical protein
MTSATTIRSFAGLLSRFVATLVLLSALAAFLPLASAQTYTIRGNTPGFIQKSQDHRSGGSIQRDLGHGLAKAS